MFEEQLARLEEVLWQAAERALGEQVGRRGELAQAIVDLSRRYNAASTAEGAVARGRAGEPTSCRLAAVASTSEQDRDLAARLVFFTPGSSPRPRACSPSSPLVTSYPIGRCVCSMSARGAGR